MKVIRITVDYHSPSNNIPSFRRLFQEILGRAVTKNKKLESLLATAEQKLQIPANNLIRQASVGFIPLDFPHVFEKRAAE